jgi:hypothetical protein
MMTSAARMRAFSSARVFDPGMNRGLRRGWTMFPLHIDFKPATDKIRTFIGLLFERDIFGPRLNISRLASKGLFPPMSCG